MFSITKNILTVNANIFNFYFILLKLHYKDNSYLRIQTVFVYNSTCKIKKYIYNRFKFFVIKNLNIKNGDKVLDVTIASINKNYYSMIVIPKYLQGIYDIMVIFSDINITVKHYSIIVKYTDDNIFNLIQMLL